MDRIINLHDFWAKELEERMAKAQREFPTMKVLYVGRAQKGSSVAESPLRNRNWLSKEDERDPVKRTQSIERYREDLWDYIQRGDAAVLGALRAIDESTILACWCYPLPCHSGVIWRAWHWLKSKDALILQAVS